MKTAESQAMKTGWQKCRCSLRCYATRKPLKSIECVPSRVRPAKSNVGRMEAMKAMKAMKTMNAMKAMKTAKTSSGLSKGHLLKNNRGNTVSKKASTKSKQSLCIAAVAAALQNKGVIKKGTNSWKALNNKGVIKKGTPLYDLAMDVIDKRLQELGMST